MSLLRFRPIGIGDEDEDQQDPLLAANGTGLPMAAPATKATPIVPNPTAEAAPIQPNPLASGKAPIGNNQLQTDQAELSRLKNTGSGLDQLGKKEGFGHKLGTVLGRIGDIAGTALFPGVTAMIPGTTLHHNMLVNQAQGRVSNDLEGDKEQAATANLNAQPELKQAALNLKQEHEDNINQQAAAKLKMSLASHGFKQDEKGNVVPLSYEEMSEQQQAVHDLKASQQELAEARTAYTQAQKENMPLAMKMAQQRIQTAQQNANTAQQKLGLQQNEFERDTFGTVGGQEVPGAPKIDGKTVGFKASSNQQKAVTEHNKNYVKPANDVEKSYQMMNDAYNEYKTAKAQGKDLPTGAQSMLALSTHLSTTFGNVKGARITKDMIEHHLGARGIGDDAVVAVQRLTNGDVLSPSQWQAFHDLIKQSRDLSWKTAVKEAQRANVPVNFLPSDIQGQDANQSGSQPKATHRFNPSTGKIEAIQ